MEYIKFKKSDNRYSVREVNSLTLNILANFLATDTGNYAYEWIDWVNDPLNFSTSSNLSFIGKEENNLIALGEIFSEEEDCGPYFEISKDKLIKILEDWDALTKQKPEQIILTVADNGDITLEGRND